MDKQGLSLSFLERHKPVLLVLSSQISAAGLNGLAKLFETGGEPIHPFQVLFVRFLITGIGCTIYLWVNERASFPTGPSELRHLFALRAAAGVFGAFGFYCERRDTGLRFNVVGTDACGQSRLCISS